MGQGATVKIHVIQFSALQAGLVQDSVGKVQPGLAGSTDLPAAKISLGQVDALWPLPGIAMGMGMDQVTEGQDGARPLAVIMGANGVFWQVFLLGKKARLG